MDRLPDELILHVFAHLEALDLVRCQQSSKRFLQLGRDANIWRRECFATSKIEAQRRRQLLSSGGDARLAALRDAFHTIAGDRAHDQDGAQDREGDLQDASSGTRRVRAMANWDPAYPAERLDYYQEYLIRNAPIAPVGWLELPSNILTQSEHAHEATGIGVIRHAGSSAVDKIVAPLDDGSICIWDLGGRDTTMSTNKGTMIGRSKSGLLSGRTSEPDQGKALTDSHAIMTDVGAVECVSIDSTKGRGLFAVQDKLHEIDLETLKTVSVETYPFAISALSEADPWNPVTVGTKSTIHLFDPRNKSRALGHDPSVRTELIGGPAASHAVLTEPNPVSILHQKGQHPDDHSIWVAGKFTHLLNYDRRFFPRLRGTVHSGAKLSCLASLPYPHIPRSMDLLQNPNITTPAHYDFKSSSGTTLLAAGEYKGKGSLELYGIPSSSTPSSIFASSGLAVSDYRNRQTASASKLLSIAPHNGTLVISDGNGLLKWLERDGTTTIRTFDINNQNKSLSSSSPRHDSGYSTPPSFNQAQTQAQSPLQAALLAQREEDENRMSSLFASASDRPGTNDIVQKIIPTHTSFSPSSPDNRSDVNQSDLLLWTGDGRIGLLGFGHEDPLGTRKEGSEKEGDGGGGVEERMERARRLALEDRERQYQGRLRRVLERQADEARFLRGFGMG